MMQHFIALSLIKSVLSVTERRYRNTNYLKCIFFIHVLNYDSFSSRVGKLSHNKIIHTNFVSVYREKLRVLINSGIASNFIEVQKNLNDKFLNKLRDVIKNTIVFIFMEEY